jgi:hypothetical protein|tara:strand:+ start:139 stop:603 length:465 start_codon:yes stop_codon:yes gene_type:complete
MNKTQLKKLIKPVVKECIQEVLIEEGLLAEVVSQVSAGLTKQPIVETREPNTYMGLGKRTNIPNDKLFNEDLQMKRKSQEANKKLQEHRRKLLDSIGTDAYNGVDLFEGTEPMKQSGTPGVAHKPNVLGDDPNDAGVDISSLMGNSSKVWQALK